MIVRVSYSVLPATSRCLLHALPQCACTLRASSALLLLPFSPLAVPPRRVSRLINRDQSIGRERRGGVRAGDCIVAAR